jgi:hypothetical protein
MTIPGPEIPKFEPMDLSKLPRMADATGVDYSRARSALAAGAPSAPRADSGAYTSAILGGLARGAGGVSATEPGSFAKALALAGAGGEEGRHGELQRYETRQDQFAREQQAYRIHQATMEMQMAQHAADVKNAQRQVDFQNAKFMWDADFKNRELAYESNLKAYGLQAPKFHAAADGIVIQSTNPDGTAKIDFMNTRPHFEHLEALGKFQKGLNIDPTMLQLEALKQMNLPPPIEKSYVHQLAINHMVETNQGGAVFGEEYNKAAKAVDARMQGTEWKMLQTTKPADYIAKRNEFISQELYNRFRASGNDAWLKQLAKASPDYLLPHLLSGATVAPVGP